MNRLLVTLSAASLFACSGLSGGDDGDDGDGRGGADGSPPTGDGGPKGSDGSTDPTCAPMDTPAASAELAMTPADSGAFPVLATVDGESRPYAVGYGFRSGDPGDWVFASRLTADGAADPGYGADGIARIWPEDYTYSTGLAAGPGPNGTLLIAFGVSNLDTGTNVLLMRLTESGALDTSFGSGGYAPVFDTSVEGVSTLRRIAMAVEGDSAYVFADVYHFNPAAPFTPGEQKVLGRRLSASSGARDPAWNFQATSGTSLSARAAGDGVFVRDGDGYLWKLSGGQIDLSFGDDGKRYFPQGFDVLPSGEILALSGSSVHLYDAQGSESETLGTLDGDIGQVDIRLRCDGRAMIMVRHDEALGAALLTESYELDPSRGMNGLVTVTFDEEQFLSTRLWILDGASGRATLFAHDRDDILYGVSITP